MSKIRFTGIMPAMLTPLDEKGVVKAATVKTMVDYFLGVGCAGFYVGGSTGEGVVLSVAQRKALAEAAVEATSGRGKVIIHTGSINPDDAMELTRHATAIGADGVSSVLPCFYYNFNMEEVCDYYKRMADNTSLPVVVYAMVATLGGTDVNKMVERLIAVDNIVGAKDTRANYYKMLALKQINGGDINIINGPDESLICGLTVGADGGIGSTYNVMPEWFVELYKRFQAGDLAGARQVQVRINKVIDVLLSWADGDLMRALKAHMNLRGFDMGVPAYPARPFTGEKLASFKAAMEGAGITYP